MLRFPHQARLRLIVPLIAGAIMLALFMGTLHAMDTFSSPYALWFIAAPMAVFFVVSVFLFINAVSWWEDKVRDV